MSLSQWLEHIASLHPAEIDLGLQRILPLAQKLRLTDFSCPVIMVGGTNGKGSIVRTLEHLYHAAGYRVAAYTSPQLLRFNERIRIGGREIDDDALCNAFEMIERNRQGTSLTFFEFVTLAALHLFQQTALDILILEVGLGGRHDAVNIVDADIAVIGTIDLDHVDRLGADRESIGYQKAGIFRAGKKVVCGDPQPPQSLVQQAKQLNCDFYYLGKRFQYQENRNNWSWTSEKSFYSALPYAALKTQNLATALMVFELLNDRYPVSQSFIENEIKNIVLEGRFEQIHKNSRLYILDVAHNPQSMAWLATQLKQLHPKPKRILAVVGMLKDKLIAESLIHLVDLIDAWYVGGLTHLIRGASAQQISDHLQALGAKICYNFAAIEGAIQAVAEADLSSQDRVVVFGSFHTVAQAKVWLEEYK